MDTAAAVSVVSGASWNSVSMRDEDFSCTDAMCVRSSPTFMRPVIVSEGGSAGGLGPGLTRVDADRGGMRRPTAEMRPSTSLPLIVVKVAGHVAFAVLLCAAEAAPPPPVTGRAAERLSVARDEDDDARAAAEADRALEAALASAALRVELDAFDAPASTREGVGAAATGAT